MTATTLPTGTTGTTTASIASIEARIETYVNRITRLEEEKAQLTEDVGQIYKEAKGEGLNVKMLRKLVALMRKDDEDGVKDDFSDLLLYANAVNFDLFHDDAPVG